MPSIKTPFSSSSTTGSIQVPGDSNRKRSLSASRTTNKIAQFFSSSPKAQAAAQQVLLAAAAAKAHNSDAQSPYSPSVALPTIQLSTATSDATVDSPKMLFSPPSLEESRRIARQQAQFGTLLDPSHKYVSEHPAGQEIEDPVEDEPPYYYLLTTYISYLILIIFGHVRDFFGKRFREANYKHLKAQNVSFEMRKQL